MATLVGYVGRLFALLEQAHNFGLVGRAGTFKIEESYIQLDFIRASSPGGQNVNKVASSVQLRFDVRNSPSLYPVVKERLIKLAGSRMTDEGILIIEANRYRTQEQNRFDTTQSLKACNVEQIDQPSFILK